MTLAIKVWDRKYDPTTKTTTDQNERIVPLVCSAGCGAHEFSLDMNGYAYYTISLDCNPDTEWNARNHEGESNIGDDFDPNDDGWRCINGHECDRDLQMALDAYQEMVNAPPKTEEVLERISIL